MLFPPDACMWTLVSCRSREPWKRRPPACVLSGNSRKRSEGAGRGRPTSSSLLVARFVSSWVALVAIFYLGCRRRRFRGRFGAG